MRKVLGYGPTNPTIMIVGEAPGEDEEKEGQPFVGTSGWELKRQLQEAGINVRDCYITNVCKYRPPKNDITLWLSDKKKYSAENGLILFDNERWFNEYIAEGLFELGMEIKERKPKVIIGLGNTPLWALTGEWGVTKWRGSEMVLRKLGNIPFVPTFHPAAILRNWEWRAQVIHDLKHRVLRRLQFGFETPKWEFQLNPSFAEVINFLTVLHGETAWDIETSRNKVVCLGIATSARQAMCIPFINETGKVWDAHDEEYIWKKIQQVTNNTQIIGQSFTAYDAAFIEGNHDFRIRPAHDTLIAQSVAYPGQPRKLGFLASMYCSWYEYWKDDAQDWNNIRDFQGLFKYNCRDCCATWESMQTLKRVLYRAGQEEQYKDRMNYSRHVFDMMQRGLLRDEKEIKRLDTEASISLAKLSAFIENKTGYPVNPLSPVQVSKLFYVELGCKAIANKKSKVEGAVSSDDAALKTIIERYSDKPEIVELAEAFMAYRSLASLQNNFIKAKLDPDKRLRSSFMPTGTETFRLTSKKNVFKRGTNLLNITDGEHVHSGQSLPNLRKAIIPPPDHTLFEIDLKKADVQVVAWESEDEVLKQMLRENADIHTENAKVVFHVREVTPQLYAFSKTFVHLTDYGGMARTAAIKCGCTIKEAEAGQKRWFDAHPGIKQWHERVRNELTIKRGVANKFGYRIIYFDRIEGLLGEGLAWVPQSTVALVTSYVHMEIDRNIQEAEVLLQVYDSVVGQYPTSKEGIVLPKLEAAWKSIVIPYKDPLVIPMDLKTSTISWGHCEKRKWPNTK